MKYVFFIFSLFPRFLLSQYLFDFEIDTIEVMELYRNGILEEVPAGRWEYTGEGSISGTKSLHHSYDNYDAGCDYFSITHDPLQESDSLFLSFRIRHGYPPSSANNWQVALLAEYTEGNVIKNKSAGDVLQFTGGLILGVNFQGSDDLLKLWEFQDSECHELCSSSLNYQEQVGTDASPEFRLIWHSNGNLNIYATSNPDEDPFDRIGFCNLKILPEGRHFVVRYEYSSARDRNLWLDDIRLEGNFVQDTIAPEICSVLILNGKYLQISFSEHVNYSPDNYFRLSGTSIGSMVPDTIYPVQGGLVIGFPMNIPNREEQILWVSGICDASANCLADTLVSILRSEAEWGDVVFNELMVDPVPAVLLPELEYLELYNRSEYELNLGEWRIEVNGRKHILTERILEPLSYEVITGIAMPNDGATMALYNETGVLVHSVRYELPWKGPDWKEEGGWSLESPDPEQVCNISALWEYSSDRTGGTPGGINSNVRVLEDNVPPQLLYLGYGQQPGITSLYYSEPVRFSEADVSLISVIPGNVKPDRVTTSVPVPDQLLLWLPEHIYERSSYRLKLPGLTDCSGNRSPSIVLQSGKTSQIRSGSILINEIMYDPLDGDPEYIELYHPGEDFIDLQDLAMDLVKEGTMPVSPVPLSDHSRLCTPGEYLVVTEHIERLMAAYNLELSGQWVEVKKLTGMQKSGGTVILTDRTGSIVDMAFYGDHMHMELLDETQGISLERISLDRSGSNPDNWHSAASIEGFFTPGRENSQSVRGSACSELLKVDPAVFSPDNDGYQDLLKITLSTGTQGWIITIWITDLAGKPMRNIANNHVAGPVVNYTWDGELENGVMATDGLYVLHGWGYYPATGEKWNRKKAFGLIYR